MNLKKFLLLSLVIFPLASLISCTNLLSTSEFYRNAVYTDTGVNKPDDFPILRATGYASISRQNGATYEIKQIRAMRASKVEAYRELSEQLNGLYIKANSRVSPYTIENSNATVSEVEGYVKGARVIRQYPIGDTYATELELDTKVVFDLYKRRGAF